MARVLIDTATYVDIQRAVRHRNETWAANTMKRAAAELANHGKPALSPLGIMEITGGFEEALKSAKLKAFLDHVLPMFQVASYGVPEARLSGEIYSKLEAVGQRIGVADTGIAATAIVQGLTVVTSNLKHFGRIVNLGYSLKIENWRDP